MAKKYRVYREAHSILDFDLDASGIEIPDKVAKGLDEAADAFRLAQRVLLKYYNQQPK